MTANLTSLPATRNRLSTAPEPTPSPLRIIVSSVSSDSHTWNLVFIQLLLEDMGHEVINLGACTPDELIIEECIRHKPDILVISSVNGHGHIDGTRMIEQLRSNPQLRHLPAVIGGKLGIRGAENVVYTKGLLAAGFNAVFEASAGTTSFESYVRKLSDARQKNALTEEATHALQ